MAVISSALGGAFAISNRSRNTVQANQERYQAQLYVNEQADLLHTFLAKNNAKRATLTGNFCVFKSGATLDTANNTSETVVDATNCKKNSLYSANIIKIGGNSGYAIYKITIVWDSLITDGQDKVELVYGT